MVSLAAPVGAMPPPPTPLSKRPTMGLKRDSSYLDTDDEAGLSQTTKRLKVEFSDDVEVRIIGADTDRTSEWVREKVRSAIHGHLAPGESKDDSEYAKLLELLSEDASSNDAPTSNLLKKYIMALGSHISVLGDCSKLVLALLDLSWLGRDEEFIRVYQEFLRVLANTHGKFMSPIMERLVSNFERLPASAGRVPGEDMVDRNTMFDRLHGVLQTIIARIPPASSALLRMLRHQFPNDMSTAKGYLQYQRHMLRLADAIPEIKGEVMSLIMQRLVDIDVQIQQDIEDLEDDDAEERLLQRDSRFGGMGAADDDEDSDDESVSESEMTTTDEEMRLKELRLQVAKMDGTQDLLFEHYQPSFTPNSTPRTNAAYQELLSHFNNFIMPHRSRHAQFLLFHFSQYSTAYSEDFINRFIKRTTARDVATPLRLQACAYVASFTARASHLPMYLVQRVFIELGRVMDELRYVYEPHSQGPDRKMYGMYYAIAQALLYIFCFRWRDLIDRTKLGDMTEEDMIAEQRDLPWIPGVKETLNRNMTSVLNPLKVCSPAIVGEFAKIAWHLRFLYVFSLIERNKRIRLGQAPQLYSLAGGLDIGRRETAWDRKTGDSHHQLEAYFPFDPYHLPQSKRWIEGEFNEWQLPQGLKNDDDDEEDEEDSDEEEEEVEEYESDDDSIPEETFAVPPLSSPGVTLISG
ncbi:Putative RNA polymerase I specific transcription initiation factor RRN3 [Septoria linicola]|uniref:RNA polymerase I specific transcription initiation factor RRN3 n=1 Tax=Septoria linicola TaxID=215465 RepID=A0A9Q9ASN4_9PEZI|nr:putative RNA polymerase I specific transcription initiation factor RRN3 [Septoria linicola]USW54395.1 Putative RNA polymerase I specific transcription initiation factor RRN3 [Septoria linicola]